MKLTAKELSGQHIGKTISVTVQDAFFRNEIHTGTLRAVTHEAETETIRGGGNHVLRTTVGQYVDLTISNARINRISTDTPITIQEGQ